MTAIRARARDVSVDGTAAPQAPRPARAGGREVRHWSRQYRSILILLDITVIVAAVAVGYVLRFDVVGGLATTDYFAIGLSITLVWIVALQYCGGYEVRRIATGPEEMKRVLRASAGTLSVLAIGAYATSTPVARGFVVGVIPLGALLIAVERALVRRHVGARRRRGDWTYRILAVGTSESVRHLLDTTTRAEGAGLQIAGACVEDAAPGTVLAAGVPVVGGVLEAASCAALIDADVVAVTGSGLGPRGVRELGWALEGSNRGLVMAPALTAIAGNRVHVTPVEGLPLVWLDQPQLGRMPRMLKRVLDIVLASVTLLLTLPLLIGTAIAIKLTSDGPVLFRQRRLGVNGAEFMIFKFRSMYSDAESRRAGILDLNEQDGGGVLFKIREDPRVTPIGRWIRRLSIDELPQLIHVLTGTMSLVGPRPLAADDSTYTGAARRRLLVKPGVTGLWQISGRSETTWDDAVRFDLYYVENWSLGLDLSILVRTFFAVVDRKGAF